MVVCCFIWFHFSFILTLLLFVFVSLKLSSFHWSRTFESRLPLRIQVYSGHARASAICCAPQTFGIEQEYTTARYIPRVITRLLHTFVGSLSKFYSSIQFLSMFFFIGFPWASIQHFENEPTWITTTYVVYIFVFISFLQQSRNQDQSAAQLNTFQRHYTHSKWNEIVSSFIVFSSRLCFNRQHRIYTGRYRNTRSFIIACDSVHVLRLVIASLKWEMQPERERNKTKQKKL